MVVGLVRGKVGATDAAWHFIEQDPRYKNREAVHQQFFTSASIENVADAVVREAVQNSMDAVSSRGQTAGVRFYLSERGLPIDQVTEFFGGFWPHLRECTKIPSPDRAATCRVLRIEDVNTTGLTGNPTEFFEPDDHRANNFYYFFRAEGRSSKTGANRGSWGIGKYTFAAASEIRAFFALTCREGDQRSPEGVSPLLMGQAVLESHQLGGKRFTPDGWWAQMAEVNDHLGPVPQQADHPQIRRFADAFDLGRVDEPGLSVVIPFIHDELDYGSIERSVLKNYAVAVAQGDVTIEVADDNGLQTAFDADNLDEAIDRWAHTGVHRKGGKRAIEASEKLVGSVQADVALARLIADKNTLCVPMPEWGPDQQSLWVADTLDEASRTALKTAFDAREPFVVDVPVVVERKGGSPPREVGVAKIGFSPASGRNVPAFYREGLRVSEVKAKNGAIADYRVMVSVEASPLAEMLGDAEGPSHVDWSSQTERFRGKYRNGRNQLAAFKALPARLVQAARYVPTQIDRELATAFFAPPSLGARRSGVGRVRSSSSVPETLGPSDSQVRVRRLSRGFSVGLPPVARPGDRLTVAFAYDVRRGDALKKWTPVDFTLDELEIETNGFTEERRAGNTIMGVLDDRLAFKFRVTGFDGVRDLLVKAKLDPAEDFAIGHKTS